MPLADLAMIGLGVMGRNLTLNMAEHGFTVAVHDQNRPVVDEFLAGPARTTSIVGASSLAELTGLLKRPRRVMMMVQAGSGVDSLLEELQPLLEPGDLIIDGGNSWHGDTTRRTRTLAAKGILFVGAGISGGAEGARQGASIMAGGNPAGWPLMRDIFLAIAARVDDEPCCAWIGAEGAGHFLKMVHNGIEYGEMQLIGEAYDFLRRGLGLDPDQLQAVFADWNRGVLGSYLLEITAAILGFRDGDGAVLLDKILDAAGQKGTGKWAGISALELGIPLTLIGEAVFARSLSARREERVRAAGFLHGPVAVFSGDAEAYRGFVHDALYAAKIIAYTQGYMLMREAARKYGWQLDYGGIALIWRGGCIIRGAVLANIAHAFARNPELENLLLDDFFRQAIHGAQAGWRKVVVKAVELGVPVPALSSGLAYYDGYRSSRLPANLLQAQRDYFGAHTYERIDRARGEFFHTDWTGTSGMIRRNVNNR
jgi:6-phosphogluconate dehydrogenase